MARTVLEVFLSSTAADLKPHRDAVYARLARIEFFKCIRQEDFGAQNVEAVQYCCNKARTADLFVGMIGLRRGWEPHGDNAKRSITEIEYDCAKEAGRGRYLWVSPDDFPVPGNLRENDTEHDRQLVFRKRVMGGGERIVSQKGFASPEALASEIVEQLLAHVVTGDLIELLRPELGKAATTRSEDQKPAIVAAVEKLAEDKDVDLLVLAKSPQGVDIADLEAKLRARAETHQAASQMEGKRSAEYWRHAGALAFLHNTQNSLSAYQKAAVLDPLDREGLRYLGELQFRVGDQKAAETSFRALTTLGENTGDHVAQVMGLIRMEWIHRRNGHLVKAQKVVETALRLAKTAKWKEGVARATNNLGLIYETRGHLDKAEKMYLQSLALYQELGLTDGLAAIYCNLGNIHYIRAEIDKAEEMHRKSLQFEEQLGRKEGIAQSYISLGVIELQKGNVKKAEDTLSSAVALSKDIGSKDGTATALWNLSFVYEQTRSQTKMCGCLLEAQELWREMRLPKEIAKVERRIRETNCSST